MTIYDLHMDISVTKFKTHCLDVIRRVEQGGQPVTIRRRGKVVARLEPVKAHEKAQKPWEKLRALGGTLLAKPGESVLADEAFEAMR